MDLFRSSQNKKKAKNRSENAEVQEEEEEEPRNPPMIRQSKLMEILECPICTEIPFPPIHNCVNGHIICKKCRPKMIECGLCRGLFNKGRNFPMEDIIMATSFTCKYKDRGCEEVVLGTKFEEHVSLCNFIPFFVLCNEKIGTPCENVMIGSELYLDHLTASHLDHDRLDMYKIPSNQDTYEFIQVDDGGNLGQNLNSDYFEQDGQAFLQKWEFKENIYYTWICALNLEAYKLEEWQAIVSVYRDAHESITNFIALLPVQDPCKNLNEIKSTGAFLCFHPSQLKAFGESGEIAIFGKTWEYYWNSHVNVKRNTDADEEESDD